MWQDLLKSLVELIDWFNPIPSAHAFTLSTTTTQTNSSFPVSLTPSSPTGEFNSQLALYGVNFYHGRWLIWGNGTCYYFCASNSESLPYAYVRTTVPSTGYYVISFSATGSRAKLRHQPGGPVVQVWDNSGTTGSYTTMEYLAQGTHYFYFWADKGSYVYLNGVTIDRR